MSLDTALNTLEMHLNTLLETLTSLRTTVVEDRPLRKRTTLEDTPALVDILGDGIENLIGCTMEASAAARDSHTAAIHGESETMRNALAACHTQTGVIAQQLFAELLTYERVGDLARVGRTRGGEWRAWASSVKQALDSSRQPLFDVQQVLLECWLEVAEHGAQQSLESFALHSATLRQRRGPGDVQQSVKS